MKPPLLETLIFAATLLAASAWLPAATAQTKLPRVGVLIAGAPTERPTVQWFEPFRRGLASQGWIEGQTVAFEIRNAGGDASRYTELAGELVRLKVDAIYAMSAPGVRAAHAATRTIPIVGHDYTTDPVAAGYAESFSRPAGNLTGVFLDAPEFSGKWIELLKTVVPGLSRAVALWDPSPGDRHLRALQGAARAAP